MLTTVLALAGCAGTAPSDGSGTSSASTPSPSTSSPVPTQGAGQRIEVTVDEAGQVTGDTGRVPVAAGTAVTLVVSSAVADVVHVHGYDRTADVGPDGPAELAFDATIPGVFEVELHDAGTVLLTLQVQ